ncbi:metal ABC transporter ATP-binding protein [Wenxinia marina]|uniref:ABC-type Mn/Zn transport system, ATPase component n=1 Tax=Wenxinia marina DSM 24838 TaxID=1123501 RepID=A0A0D0QF45_9RHOB|nr:metal ABC transporter ATP-binding protein [Wenxinia marina]KIQ69613.1 ABC-type Mn/Zn transport system, ATPase component [Wenxinia marina DSM 24838]GGL59744.1 zinc import ATP-binding protein ZnuC [Wenxinia marina]
MTLLSVEGLGVRHGATEVLHDVSLAVDRGEIVTIVGPNGSGKTSLFRAIVGAVPAASGRIVRAPGLVVGYLPQRLHVDPALPITVERFLRLPGGASRADVTAALARAGVPEIARRQMSQLSGGQLQRALLARALVARPGLLLLDEPTAGLDQPGSAAFYRLIEEVRRETGCAVLMISHELHVVMAASDRVICLNRHVCCHGTPEHVSSAPEYRALFGTGTGGALALYRHDHDHHHHHAHDHHDHDHAHHHHDRHAHDHPEHEAAD